jgi:hypothetical protein
MALLKRVLTGVVKVLLNLPRKGSANMARSEITIKLDAKQLMKDFREEIRQVFEHGHKAGFDAADNTSRSQVSASTDDWLAFEAKVFDNA